jgi:sec-independent protein translocase protein TatC
MYQVWLFIAPALYANEKKLALSFALLASLGTLGGALFSHYVLFPAMVSFFGLFRSPHLRFMPGIENTFDQYIRMLLSMILVFQLPTLVFFLAKLQVVTARWLWRHIKYAVLLSVVAGALLTPSPDPWNQMVFAAPMFLLYVISIGIAWAVAPRQPRQATSHAAPTWRVVLIAAIFSRGFRKFIANRRPLQWQAR